MADSEERRRRGHGLGSRLTLQVTPGQKALLEQLADRDGITVSRVARRALKAGLKVVEAGGGKDDGEE